MFHFASDLCTLDTPPANHQIFSCFPELDIFSIEQYNNEDPETGEPLPNCENLSCIFITANDDTFTLSIQKAVQKITLDGGEFPISITLFCSQLELFFEKIKQEDTARIQIHEFFNLFSDQQLQMISWMFNAFHDAITRLNLKPANIH